MITEEIERALFALQDEKYRDFQAKLLPTVDPERIIGVRTPALRDYAGEIAKRPEVGDFLAALPHPYFDENQLHAFVISLERDYGRCVAEVNAFLPFVDNWATCDQLSPKVFKKHKPALLGEVRRWMATEEPYTVRFGIGMLMEHFLDADFDPAYPAWVAALRSGEYYVNMMIAWYFATALAKQYEAVLPYIEGQKLDAWAHNKAIQKAIESYRVPQERKDYLRTLKRSGKE